ncbi:MAG: DUF3109 family protein [Prevotella sp.]|nr:DUF3109 family protein [Prevotella sp.]
MKLPIVVVDDVLLSPEIITEKFCCDTQKCHGKCCVEGDAGAPLTLEEIALIEESLEKIQNLLSKKALEVIARQGIAYCDIDGELVTSIIEGKDCVFAHDEGGSRKCAIEMAYQKGEISFRKPISCALYPIREKKLDGDTIGLNFHHWDVCLPGRIKGNELNIPLYKFLEEPLKQRFGKQWFKELEKTIRELRKSGYIK